MSGDGWQGKAAQFGADRILQRHGALLARLLPAGSRALAASLARLAGHLAAIRLPIALGQAYEQILAAGDLNGETVSLQRLSRKASGAYYTPVAIAQYMVQATVGPSLAAAAAAPPSFRILDPACGGGIFLVVAYQALLDWRRRQCLAQLDALVSNRGSGATADLPIYQDGQGCWWLTPAERERILRSHLYGMDLDPTAVEVARLALGFQFLLNGAMDQEGPLPLPDLGDRLLQGNALLEPGDQSDGNSSDPDWQDSGPSDWRTAFPKATATGGFDVVLGNPPYLDSVAMTAHLPHWRHYCTRHYQTAVGNWDLFCVFIEQAVALCKPGGLHSFIVPNKLASAEYTAAVRSLLAQTTRLLTVRDYSQTHAFAASVYPLVYVVRKREPSLQSTSTADDPMVTCEVMQDLHQVKTAQSCAYSDFISPSGVWLLQPTAAQLTLLQPEWSRLGAIAQALGAATVAEAYVLKAQMGDRPHPSADDLRVVNSGTLDPYALLWGQKPMQYLGDRYRHPVVPATWLQTHLPTRYHQATRPKLIVAGLTKRLECGLDEAGTFLAGKSTSIIQSETVPLLLLLGLLNSAFVSQLFRHLFGGNGLSGGYLRVGPPQLRQLPVPPVARLRGEGGDRLITLTRQRLGQQSQGQAAKRTAELLECDRAIDNLVRDLYQVGAIDD